MTTDTRSRRLPDIFRFYGGNKGTLCLRTKVFHWHMSEQDFHDYTCSSMSRWMSEQPQDGRNTPMAAGDEYPQELAAGDDDKIRDASVRETLYDQRPISGEVHRWYSSSGPPSQPSVFVDRDFDWRTVMRGPRVDD